MYSKGLISCYYNTSELGKRSLSYRGLRQLRLITFQWTSESEVGQWISDLDFYWKVFAFCILYCQNFWPRVSCSLQLIQPTSQDVMIAIFSTLPSRLLTIILIFNTTYRIECCKYRYCLGWFNLCVILISFSDLFLG